MINNPYSNTFSKAIINNNYISFDPNNEPNMLASAQSNNICLKSEVILPSEIIRKGKGIIINYGWFDSPYGFMLILATKRGVCGLALTDNYRSIKVLEDMVSRWPQAHFVENQDSVIPCAKTILEHGTKADVYISGSQFQIKVWETVLKIPLGNVTTYSQIANYIGKPKAVRAVATAIGHNPVCWLIPCHRVLPKAGGLGGYHWGLSIKYNLLNDELSK